jgi:hypothetical protein
VADRDSDRSFLTWLEDIVRYPGTYSLALAIPKKRRAGRPRDFPEFMYVVYLALVSVYRSARQVAAELDHPVMWRHLRRLVKKQFPDDPTMRLPSKPMKRHHYLYARRWLRNPEIIRALKTIHRQETLQLAKVIGLLPSEATGLTHPDLRALIHADAKVIRPLFKAKRGEKTLDKRTGELRPLRFDPDARLHVQGDGEIVWGNSFVIASMRTDDANTRLILDWESVSNTEEGGEGAAAVAICERLASLSDEIVGIIYDMTLRGVHIERLMADLGWLTVTRVPARSNPNRKGGKWDGPREEKETLIEVRPLPGPDGRMVDVALHSVGGALGFYESDERGDPVFVRLPRVRTLRRPNKRGYRFYNEYRLPESLGGGLLRVRLIGSETDRRRKLNRAENLRAIPPSDPDFARLYGRRNDAESTHRGLRDSMFLDRAHSVGVAGQDADLLGFALLRSARTYGQQRRGEEPLAA